MIDAKANPFAKGVPICIIKPAKANTKSYIDMPLSTSLLPTKFNRRGRPYCFSLTPSIKNNLE